MRFPFIAAALLFATACAPGVPQEAEDIAHRLERIRDAHSIPALAGAAVDEGEIVAIGVTPYLFIYFRAKQGPWINEADASTWDALLAVIRRAHWNLFAEPSP